MKIFIRILVVPFLFLLFYSTAILQIEKIGNLKWIEWTELENSDVYETSVYLKAGKKYRVALFLHYKDKFNRDNLNALVELLDESGDKVFQSDFFASRIGLVNNLINSALKDKVRELFNDSDYDPANHTKVLQSTSVFSVEKDDKYKLNFTKLSSPELRKVGLLINTEASDFPQYFGVTVLAFIPLFLLTEVFYFIKKFRFNEDADNEDR